MVKLKVRVEVREKGDSIFITRFRHPVTRSSYQYRIPKEEVPDKFKVAMALADLAGEDERFHHKFTRKGSRVGFGGHVLFFTDVGYSLCMDPKELRLLLEPYQPIPREEMNALIHEGEA